MAKHKMHSDKKMATKADLKKFKKDDEREDKKMMKKMIKKKK